MPSAYTRTGNPPASQSNLFGLNATTGFTVSWWYKYLGGQSFTGRVFRQSGASNTRDGYSIQIIGNDVQVDVFGNAGATTASLNFLLALINPTRWNHIAITFDDSTNQVVGYVNGKQWNQTTNTRDMTANGTSCLTELMPIGGANYIGWIFDLQVLPDVVVRVGDIPLLMNPTYSYPGVKGRYFGLDFATTTGGSLVYDESGNGNNVTVTAGVTLEQGDEPPFRPTFD